jgi:N-acyl-D-amino-acid deacylase
LNFDPGTNYAYSNFGFCVLGRVIEKVTAQAYDAYVKANVLAPMDIHAMRIGRSLLADRAAKEVKYYDYPGAGPVQCVFPGVGLVPTPYGGFYVEAMDSHGGWIASAIDLVRFMTALDGHRGQAFLSTSSLAAMTARPSTISTWATSSYWYGFGLLIRPSGTDANWWHNGSLPGTSTLLVRAYHGYSWAILANIRPTDSGGLGSDMDGGMWTALGSGLQGSATDLFLQYPSQ